MLRTRWLLAVAALFLGTDAPRALAAAPCAAKGAAVSRKAPVRIPFELSGNHVLVTVCAGGRDWTFLLDTGAGGITADITAVRELGFKLGQTLNISGAGANAVQGFAVTKGAVRVAGLDDDFDVTTTWAMQRLRLSKGRPIHGILGMPFIDRYVLQIDYAARELVLHDRKAFTYSGAGTSVPIELQNGQPVVQADITLADGQSIHARCLVDVGSAGSLLITKPVAEQNDLRSRIGPLMPWGGGGGVGGPVTNDIGRVAKLSIGGVELTSVTASLFGDGAGVFSNNRLWDANIGEDILRRFVVYFDYRGKRMILEPTAMTGEPFEVDMSGLRVSVDTLRDVIVVDAITPGSPAAESGVQPGDVIQRADGRDLHQRDVDALRERLRRVDQAIDFVLGRGGDSVPVRLTTRRRI